MEEELKRLLNELQDKENARGASIDEINAEIKRVGFREETETERFLNGMNEDRNAGIYNNKTDGEMQKIVDEEVKKIKAKYNTQRAELGQKLEETTKKNAEEKASDYKQISAAIKNYHVKLVLRVNEENKTLTEIEAELNSKLKELDEKIAAKEAERTHAIMKNRNSMDIESTLASLDIQSIGQDIETLKEEREAINGEYSSKLKVQSDIVEHHSQQKERAAKFMGSIILSEKSIDEIYEILFDKEKEQKQGQQSEVPLQEGETIEVPAQNTEKEQNQEQQSEAPVQEGETVEVSAQKEELDQVVEEILKNKPANVETLNEEKLDELVGGILANQPTNEEPQQTAQQATQEPEEQSLVPVEEKEPGFFKRMINNVKEWFEKVQANREAKREENEEEQVEETEEQEPGFFKRSLNNVKDWFKDVKANREAKKEPEVEEVEASAEKAEGKRKDFMKGLRGWMENSIPGYQMMQGNVRKMAEKEGNPAEYIEPVKKDNKTQENDGDER